MRDNKIEAVVKDGKGAIKTEDGWESAGRRPKNNGDGGFNPAMFIARRMQNYKLPAMEAQTNLAGFAADLAKSDAAYAGEMTPEAAKKLMTFGGRRGGGRARPSATPKAQSSFGSKTAS